MDRDFAFSFHRTTEQWEQEQRESAEFSRECDELELWDQDGRQIGGFSPDDDQ